MRNFWAIVTAVGPLLLAVEIVADRGIHSKVDPRGWETICRDMKAAFAKKNYEAGMVDGIRAVAQHLMHHFPSARAAHNGLPDQPVVL